MGFKAGLVVGLGVGYWFGAKAGEERYAQLEAMAERLRESRSYQTARERARDKVGTVVDDGVARAKSIIGDVTEQTGAIDLTEGSLFDQDLDG